MGTFNLQIQTTKDVSSYKKPGQKIENGVRLLGLIQGIVSGAFPGSILASSSATDPVAASGTIELTYASINADDTVTVAGVVLTCKGSGTVAGTFVKVTDATATATNLKNAINANASLAAHLVATSAAGIVTTTARQKGSIGNLLTLVTSNATGFDITAMAGGTGGSEGATEVIR